MHSHNNGLKTVILLSSMFAILALIGSGLSIAFNHIGFMCFFMMFGLWFIFYSYWNSDKIAIRSMNAYPVNEQQQPQMHKIVAELSQKAGKPMPRLYVAPTNSPNAFATGRNPNHAAVCCTHGILAILNERELRAVLAHELMHVYNRDILTSSVAAGIGSLITSLAHLAFFAGGRGSDNRGNIFSSILLALLAPVASTMLQLAISRTREYDADEDGAHLCEDPLALASALKKLESGIQLAPLPETPKTEQVSHMMIANPFGSLNAKNFFSTHPPTEERIKRLEEIAGY